MSLLDLVLRSTAQRTFRYRDSENYSNRNRIHVRNVLHDIRYSRTHLDGEEELSIDRSETRVWNHHHDDERDRPGQCLRY